MDRKKLAGITGRLLHADRQEEVQVVGDEVWEEWTGQTVEAQTRGRGEGRMGGQGESSFTGDSTKECGQGPSI